MNIRSCTRFLIISVLFLSYSFKNTSVGQELSGLKEADPFTYSGNLSINQIGYTSTDSISRRDPYTYYISGALNLTFFREISVPLSFTYSNQNFQHSQPFNFNQFGMQPSYKWIKTYIGYNSMNFSPYTLSGHQFLGVGVELEPEGLFNFAFMYGRLLKAVEEDTTSEINTPSYRRMGYGFKIGIKHKNDFMDVILFHAYDDTNSLENPIVYSEITPKENLVLSLRGKKQITNGLSLELDFANSALTRNTRSLKSSETDYYFKDNFLFTHRNSSYTKNAFNSLLNYSFKSYSLGLGYERIDPEYETLGTYFFNNDLENVTVRGNTTLFENKLSVSFNVGKQRNNLDDNNASSMKKNVGSVNVNFNPTQKINFSGGYSNFTAYTRVQSDFKYINSLSELDYVDTLVEYSQVTQSTNFSLSYILGDIQDKNKKQHININGTVQSANDETTGDDQSPGGSKFYNGSVLYGINIAPTAFSTSVGFHANMSEIIENKTTMLGPTISVSKGMLDKKLRNTLSSSYNKSYQNDKEQGSVFNTRLTSTYTYKKQHNLSLSIVVLNKNTPTGEGKFTEMTATLGYNFNFTSQKEK